ncbi:CaiB/BaiF CoA transferase family protein [Chloroflexota bacterium]
MQILEGIRVVEWSVFHQGPSAGVKLAEMGADVIKLEEPGKGDQARGNKRMHGVSTDLPGGRNWFYEFLNYGKRGVAIDLKSQRGKEIVYSMIEGSDVFFTNFRRKAAVKLGLDYETLRRVNPKLIYASSSCLGNLGPFGDSPGLEGVAMARSGLSLVAGEGNQPPVPIVSSVTDQTGGLLLTIGILAALFARERSGIGQEVTTSQLGGGMLLQILNVMARILSGKELGRGVGSPPRNPLYNYYRCQDNRWIIVFMNQNRYWERFCRAIERPDWFENPKFVTLEGRAEHSSELTKMLEDMFASEPYDVWEKKLSREDLIFSIVNTTSAVLEDPQVVANNLLPTVDHPVLGKTRWLLTPIQFSQTPLAFHGPAPELGQHTEEVLIENFGYSWDDVNKLREEGVI